MTREREQNGEPGDGAVDVDVYRRDVLVTGAITSGSLLYGCAAASDTAGARRGSVSGFIPVDDFEKALDDDRTFEIRGANGWSLTHPPGCGRSTSGPAEAYTGYEIGFAEGDEDRSDPPTLGHLYVESDRHVTTGSWLDVTASRACPPDATVTNPSGGETEQAVVNVSFRPTDFGGRAEVRAGEAVLGMIFAAITLSNGAVLYIGGVPLDSQFLQQPSYRIRPYRHGVRTSFKESATAR